MASDKKHPRHEKRKKFYEFIKKKASAAINAIKNGYKSLKRTASAAINATKNGYNSIKQKASPAINAIKNGYNSLKRKASPAINATKNGYNSLKQKASPAINAIKNGYNSLKRKASTAIENGYNNFKKNKTVHKGLGLIKKGLDKLEKHRGARRIALGAIVVLGFMVGSLPGAFAAAQAALALEFTFLAANALKNKIEPSQYYLDKQRRKQNNPENNQNDEIADRYLKMMTKMQETIDELQKFKYENSQTTRLTTGPKNQSLKQFSKNHSFKPGY